MTINVKIVPKNRHESSDRMIRRFIKKTKKIKLMDELRERKYYTKPSEIKRTEKRRAILLEESNYSNKRSKNRR